MKIGAVHRQLIDLLTEQAPLALSVTLLVPLLASFPLAREVPVTMLVIKNTMGVTGYAPAGSNLGLFVIGLCGLAGGFVFARITARREG